MNVSIIVAAAENNVIGKDNQMPWHLANDMKHFKALTLEHGIVMGRKTFESIGRKLPGRKNIILTRDAGFTAEECTVVHSFEEAVREILPEQEAFIIGGAEIYKLFWPVADTIYLTRVHTEPEGDATIPPIDGEVWEEKEARFHPRDEKNDYDHTLITYKRKPLR